MTTTSAHDNPTPMPLRWQIVAARNDEVPTDSQPATLQRRWRALGRVLPGADDADPLRAGADQRPLPQVSLRA